MMSSINIEWHGREVTSKVSGACKKVVNKTARYVSRVAKTLVPVDENNTETQHLKESIYVSEWAKPGVKGAYVSAGAYQREHIAGFVELGTPGETYTGKKRGQDRTPIKAQPYLRPATRKGQVKMKTLIDRELKRVLK